MSVANKTENHDIDKLYFDKVVSATGKENRASISSGDSNISLSYDAIPFTPRTSITTTSSSTDDELKKYCSTVTRKESNQNIEDEAPFNHPDKQLARQIVDQVEYYFSDENIVKDAFLLKHVRRNKEGYVSLKLIASFKRVKHMTRDWRVVQAALQTFSTKLQINEAGTKLRRRNPLPRFDQTPPSRTVVAVDIPADKATIESVAELFRSCGEIVLVRILRPANPIPADIRAFYNKHPEMRHKINALIEFVRTESAHNALHQESANSVPHVLELNASPKKKQKRFTKKVESTCQNGEGAGAEGGSKAADDFYDIRLERRSSFKELPETPCWSQRRWSRDSGNESASTLSSPFRPSGGGHFIPHQRRASSGWESGSESYNSGSGRSRSSSAASLAEMMQSRRYSVTRNGICGDSICCCCGFPKCESVSSRRYMMRRASTSDDQHHYSTSRGESFEEVPQMYSFRKSSDEGWGARHQWGTSGRSNSLTPTTNFGDIDGGPLNFMRRRSFGSGVAGLPASVENVIRLPRGPDGSRGFQKEPVLACALAE